MNQAVATRWGRGHKVRALWGALESAAVVGALMGALVGCAEATVGAGGSGAGSSGGAGGSFATGGAGGAGTGGADTGGSAAGASGGAGGEGGAGPAALVINEIHPEEDWVELYNPTSAVIDLAGLTVADDDAGAPKLAEAVTFVAGASLAPGGYLLVGGKENCPSDPHGAACVMAPFGISKGGDVVYVLDVQGAVVLSATYPADAVADPALSWGRFPSATGDFATTASTPGGVNKPH